MPDQVKPGEVQSSGSSALTQSQSGQATPTPPPPPPPMNQPPSVVINSPAVGQVISAKTFTFKATGSDDVGVTWMELFINGKSIKREPTTTISRSINMRPYNRKNLTVTATAEDADGLKSEASVIATVNL